MFSAVNQDSIFKHNIYWRYRSKIEINASWNQKMQSFEYFVWEKKSISYIIPI